MSSTEDKKLQDEVYAANLEAIFEQAKKLKAANPNLTGEEAWQKARSIILDKVAK